MSLTAFLAQNAERVENVKVIASTRFKSDQIDPKTKKPLPEPFEVRVVPGTVDDELRKACTRQVPVPGKKGQFRRELDADTYLTKLAAEATVYPDLKSVELQDSYKVHGEEALLRAMLTPGEYANYTRRVAEINGFESFQEEVDDAKN